MFKILESNATIRKRILYALAEELNSFIPKRLDNIKKRVQGVVQVLIRDSSGYRAMDDGTLAAHLGIWRGHGRAKMEAIIQSIINNIEVKFTALTFVGNKYEGGLEIGIFDTDLSEVFSLDRNIISTYYKSENYPEGYWLPWAEWLFKRGSDLIITDYQIKLQSGVGRSKQALMIEGGAWKVPMGFEGVLDDNILTRAITQNKNMFLSAVTIILRNELS